VKYIRKDERIIVDTDRHCRAFVYAFFKYTWYYISSWW